MSHRSSVLTVCLCLALATPAAGQKPAGQPAASELIRTLQGREFTEAVGAADRLGGFASQPAQVVPAVIDVLRNREWAACSGDVRDAIARSGARALGLIDNPSVTIPVLVQLLARGNGSEASGVKWEASESLVKVGKRPGGDAVRPRLAGLLGEPDGLTVALAARALAALGDARGVTKLRELTTHAETGTRQEAVLALGTLPDKGGADVVRHRLKDDNLAVRATAI